MVRTLADQAQRRIEAGLRPKTSSAYTAMFKLPGVCGVYEVITSIQYGHNSIVFGISCSEEL